MEKIFIIISIITWYLNLIVLTKKNILIYKENLININTLKYNLSKIFSVKTIVLFIIFNLISFIYREVPQIDIVNFLLFNTMNIYLFIYNYYDSNKELEISLVDILSIIVFILLSIIPTILFILTKVYYLLFAYNLISFIILYIPNKIFSIVRRIDNEIEQL